MKKLLIFLFSLLISFNSYGSWTWIGENLDNTNFYIDFEKTKKVDEYIYYWMLSDLLKPDKDGDFSYITYDQGDCKLSRIMSLSEFYYTQPMGEGRLTTNNIINPEWKYPAPGSMTESMLEEVCDYVK